MAKGLLKQIQAQIDYLEIERKTLFKKREPIDKAITKNYKLLSQKRDELGRLKESTTGFSTLELLRYNRLKESDPLYKAQRKFFEDNGFHAGGFLPSTENKEVECQREFATCFYQDNHPKGWTLEEQVDKIIKFFNTYSDKMLPIEDNMLFLDVFESTLSEYGTYNILVNMDLKTAKLIKTTYGHKEIRKQGTFKEVLDFTAKYHYYQ